MTKRMKPTSCRHGDKTNEKHTSLPVAKRAKIAKTYGIKESTGQLPMNLAKNLTWASQQCFFNPILFYSPLIVSSSKHILPVVRDEDNKRNVPATIMIDQKFRTISPSQSTHQGSFKQRRVEPRNLAHNLYSSADKKTKSRISCQDNKRATSKTKTRLPVGKPLQCPPPLKFFLPKVGKA